MIEIRAAPYIRLKSVAFSFLLLSFGSFGACVGAGDLLGWLFYCKVLAGSFLYCPRVDILCLLLSPCLPLGLVRRCSGAVHTVDSGLSALFLGLVALRAFPTFLTFSFLIDSTLNNYSCLPFPFGISLVKMPFSLQPAWC